MLNKNEIAAITISTIILGFVFSIGQALNLFLYTALTIFLIILINIAAKKVASFYLDSEIEIKLWEIQRYGFKASKHFKKPVPAGVFFPIIFAALSFGHLKWMACIIFDAKAKIYKAAKRHSLYSFSEISENEIGLIAGAGILANLFFAIVGYLVGFETFARLNIYYAFFNMLPISDLDGNKIFFGNLPLWSFLASLVLIGLGIIVFVV